MQSQRRIVIIGAGLGGIALAVAIGKYNSDIPIDLYEAGEKITTAGAGVTMWKRTWQFMQRLGMDEDLSKRAVVPPTDQPAKGILWRKANIIPEGYDMYDQMVPFGSIGLHRADLLDVLVKHLPKSCTVHTSKRLTHYIHESGNEGPATLYFADGTIASADVIIGADGIRSATRRTMYEQVATESGTTPLKDHLDPIWSGAVTYRYLIPREKLEKAWPNHRVLSRNIIYAGKGKHIVSYAVSQGRFINIVAFYTHPDSEGTPFEGKWVTDTSKQELVSRFTDMEDEARALLQACLMETPSRWAVHVMKPLPRWTFGNVTLLGDASHAMRPSFGTGAGAAMEDAFILARLLALSPSTRLSIPQLLQIYEMVRLPVGNALVVGAREVSFMYEFDFPGYADGSSQGPEDKQEDMRKHREGIQERFNNAHFATVPDEEWVEAEGLVKQWEKEKEEKTS